MELIFFIFFTYPLHCPKIQSILAVLLEQCMSNEKQFNVQRTKRVSSFFPGQPYNEDGVWKLFLTTSTIIWCALFTHFPYKIPKQEIMSACS